MENKGGGGTTESQQYHVRLRNARGDGNDPPKSCLILRVQCDQFAKAWFPVMSHKQLKLKLCHTNYRSC